MSNDLNKQLEEGDLTAEKGAEAISALVNPERVTELMAGIEAADPPLLRSSAAFKAAKTALQALQETLKDPKIMSTPKGQRLVDKQLRALQEKSETYVKDKKEEVAGNPNETEARRIAAVEKVLDYARRSVEVTDRLPSVQNRMKEYLQFEKFHYTTSAATSKGQLDDLLEQYFHPEGLEPEKIMGFVGKNISRFNKEGIVKDSREFAARQALSNTVHEQMRSIEYNKFERKAFEKKEIPAGLDRLYLDILGGLDTQEEYDRRWNIFVSDKVGQVDPNDKEAVKAQKEKVEKAKRKRAEFFLKGVENFQTQLKDRQLDLFHLTDEDIARNFEFICKFEQFVGQLRELSTHTKSLADLKLKENERKALEECEKFYAGALSVAFNRGKEMAHPYFAYYNTRVSSADQLTYMGQGAAWSYLNNEKDLPVEEPFESLFNEAYFVLGHSGVVCGDYIEKMLTETFRGNPQLENCSLKDVEWMDEKGNLLTADEKTGRPDTSMMMKGHPLIAALPDGSMKYFQNTTGEVELPGLKTEGTQKALSVVLNAEIPNIAKILDDADPRTVISSSRFRAVKEALEQVQKCMEKPDILYNEEGQRVFFDQMGVLKKAAGEYVNWKEQQVNGKPNRTESKRIAAVKKILSFADKRMGQLETLEGVKQVRDKINFYKEQANNQLFGHSKAMEFFLNVHRSVKNTAANLPVAGMLDEEHIVSMEKSMARMVAADLLLGEQKAMQRKAEKMGGKPEKGKIENLLENGKEKELLRAVKKTPQFQSVLEQMDKQNFHKFLLKNGARSITRSILKEADRKKQKETSNKKQKEMSSGVQKKRPVKSNQGIKK